MSIKISGFQVGAGGGLPQYGALPKYYSVGAADTPSVIYAAPADSVTLICIATDVSTTNNDLYIDGSNHLISKLNGGAQYWQYTWLSAIENASTVTDVTLNSIGATYTDGNAARYVVAGETLIGASAIPTYVGGAAYQESGTQTITTAGFGVNDGEIVVVHASVEKGGGQITSMTGGGLTWTRKSSKSHDSSHESGQYQTTEIWYAINQTGSGIEDYVNITYSSPFDDQTTIVTTWAGVNLSTPFLV